MPDCSFTVRVDDLRAVRAFDDGAASRPLGEGEVRFRVGPFSLTANNVTYGVLGRAFGYFDFYPAPEAGEGIVPVWGFATVTESRAPGVAVGERFYGYLPPSSHAILCPGKVSRSGFVEASPHRAGLPAIYNQYQATAADPRHRAEAEGAAAVFRPLLATAFLLGDFLVEEAYFGATRIVLSSASSKTALATAALLSAARASGGPRVVGLTQPSRQSHLSSLGCYDEVVPYGEVDRLGAEPTVYIDFAGDAALRARLHEALGDALRHDAIVGSTHWSARQPSGRLPGVEPTLFFAPSRAAKRAADWGRDELTRRIAAASADFAARALGGPEPWVRVVAADGLPAVLATWAALLAGEVPADEARVFTV
ncbi:MAG: DUF2855 family protein [Deltaproteobacteria bacterium]|nr:DUF2855 family protein [Deltaproteobacteria bacterium]